MKKRSNWLYFMAVIIINIIINVNISYASNIIYEEIVVDIPVGKEDSASNYIRQALEKAKKDSTKYYKVIIKPQEGKTITQYYLKNQLLIYDNTWLYVDDQGGKTPIVFNKCHEYAMVTSGNRDLSVDGYNGFKNIKIEGGIWNGKTDYYDGQYSENAGFNHFRFAHGKNLEIKNLKIINNNNAHHIQVGGINGLVITGCEFNGYDRMTNSYKEAIQLDILSSEDVFGSAEKYDDTPMINVDIYNNVFKNVDRGVGTHSATIGIYHKNIKIRNNIFTGIDDYAIAMMNYKDTVVENNLMTDVEGGVILMYAKSDFSQFYRPNVLQGKVEPACSTIIRNNDITLNNNKTTIGIRSYGMIKSVDNKVVMTKAGVGYEDFSVSGITITNNKIRNVKVDGIGLVGTTKSTVSNNMIIYGKDSTVAESNASGKGIYLKNSSSNTVSNNTVDNSAKCNNLKHGIILYENSTSNTIKSNNIKGSIWYGINSQDTSSGVLDSNIVDASKKTGIYITGGSTVDTSKNTVKNISTSGHGIYYYKAKGNYIKNNTIATVKENGICLYNGSKVTDIKSNSISSCKGDAININCKSTVTNLHSNTISAPSSDGIYVYNGSKVNSIYANKITSTGDNGIYVRTSSSSAEIKNNVITTVKDHGIYIDYKCNVTNVVGNQINKPTKVGIYVNNKAVAKYIKSNKITSAKANGIYIKNSTCTEINSNTVKSSRVVYIYKSKVTNIKSNSISGSASHGMYIKGSTVTTVTSNKLNSNKSNGLYINSSKVKSVTSNTCSSNKNTGIYLYKTTLTNVNSNKCNSNKKQGIYVYASKASNCNSNSLSSNKSNGLSINKSTVTNVKSNKPKSSGTNGIYVYNKSKVTYLYSNKVSKSKKKAIYIYKATVSKIKGNSGKVVKKK